MPRTHLDTGTATDLLIYEYFENENRYERVTCADQEWIVQDWDGERYVIHFTNNFSKKHLYTFSKRTHEVQVAAYYEWLNGGSDPARNWEKAEHQRLHSKLETSSRNRIEPFDMSKCSGCGHSGMHHLSYDSTARTGGACSAGTCTCPHFYRYEDVRDAIGKAENNVLAGASTKKNSCIILNWVPKSEFESVVCQSIQAHEKRPGWSRGDPLALSPGDEVVLRWDFGVKRKGAVIFVDLRSTATDLFTQYQGCEVKARKTDTDWGVQTYEIFHWEGMF